MKRMISLLAVMILMSVALVAQDRGGDNNNNRGNDQAQSRDGGERNRGNRGDRGGDRRIQVTENGLAIILDSDIAEADDAVTITQTINAYDAGGTSWTNSFDSESNLVIRDMAVMGNDIVLTLRELPAEPGVRPEEPTPTTFQVLDANSGAEKWSLSITNPSGLKSDGNGGFYLQYTALTETTASAILAYVDASGNIVWEETLRTRERSDQ